MAVGLALVVVLIVLPSVVEDDYYEIIDPLVFMGVPLLVVSAALGALVGAPRPQAEPGGDAEEAQRPSALARAVVSTVAVAAAAAATWLFLWAVGAVDAAPLGLW
jgi:hypothetical protein